jgi:hypothetical protein
MDDLDRLYDRLATNVRDGFPHLLDRAFQLGDIGEHLVPYRLNRRELGFDSVRQYELALMRLAAGERGLLRADAPVQDAFRRALATPEPDAALLRDHARAAVALAPPGAAPRAPAPPPSATGVFGAAPVDAPMTEPTFAATATPVPAPPNPAGPSPSDTPVQTAPDPFGITPATFGMATPTWTEPPVAPEPQRPTGSVASGRPARADQPLEPRPGPTIIGGPCRYCGQALPEGRPVTFCPQCDQNVTVQQCPACSTELEIGWRFCITCGRAMDEAALNARPR